MHKIYWREHTQQTKTSFIFSYIHDSLKYIRAQGSAFINRHYGWILYNKSW